MSKLEELIKEFCPNGVRYELLVKATVIERGRRLIKSQLKAGGKYPVFQNSMSPLGYYDKFNCLANTTFVIAAGAAGEIGFSIINFWAADDCFYFKCSEKLNTRFLYHVLLPDFATFIIFRVCKRSRFMSNIWP